jgi:hypothetical protein
VHESVRVCVCVGGGGGWGRLLRKRQESKRRHACRVLKGTQRYSTVVQGAPRYYRVVQGPTGYYRVLIGPTGYYSVLKGPTWYYRVLQGSAGYYGVLKGPTGYYRVLYSVAWTSAVLKYSDRGTHQPGCGAVGVLEGTMREGGERGRRASHTREHRPEPHPRQLYIDSPAASLPRLLPRPLPAASLSPLPLSLPPSLPPLPPSPPTPPSVDSPTSLPLPRPRRVPAVSYRESDAPHGAPPTSADPMFAAPCTGTHRVLQGTGGAPRYSGYWGTHGCRPVQLQGARGEPRGSAKLRVLGVPA